MCDFQYSGTYKSGTFQKSDCFVQNPFLLHKCIHLNWIGVYVQVFSFDFSGCRTFLV